MWHWINADESNLFDAKFRHLACLLKNFKREFPFFKIFSKINLLLNVCSRSTPRYRTDFFEEIFVSPHLISKDGELPIFLHDPNKIDYVLPRCKESLLSISQLLKAQSSFPSVSCMTLMSFPETNKAESSAYKMSLHFTADSMSLTYIRKSNGPRMEPCGTPQGTILGLEKVPFISNFMGSIR